MKKLITLFLLIGLCLGLLVYNFSIPKSKSLPEPEKKPVQSGTSAQSTEPTNEIQPTQPPVRQVRIANSDPDLQAAWEKLAEDYTRRTGVSVTVVGGNDPTATLFTVRSMEELAALMATYGAYDSFLGVTIVDEPKGSAEWENDTHNNPALDTNFSKTNFFCLKRNCHSCCIRNYLECNILDCRSTTIIIFVCCQNNIIQHVQLDAFSIRNSNCILATFYKVKDISQNTY